MKNILKFLHLAGLAAFLGSILAYIVISIALESEAPASYAFARRVISAGTYYLTVPGMCIVMITGAVMAVKERGLLGLRWVRVKLIVSIAIALNAYFMVLPAVDGALTAALESVGKGALTAEYNNYYLQESIFGALNVILILLAVAAGVWKWRGRIVKASTRLRAIS